MRALLFAVTAWALVGCAQHDTCKPEHPEEAVATPFFGKPIYQPTYPLYLAIDPDMPAAQVLNIRIAAEAWNITLGKRAFVVGVVNEPQDPGGVVVPVSVLRDKEHPNVLGVTVWHMSVTTGRIGSTEVRIRADAELVVPVHELGHVLGLDHDPNPHSLMWPYTSTGSQDVIEHRDLQYVRSTMRGCHG